jgi:formylmethanofuran dehydrogenase subunit E
LLDASERFDRMKTMNAHYIKQRHGKDICSYTFEEYLEEVKTFHGYAAPGVLIGGFMVDMAYRHIRADSLYDVISETSKCLPDAVQLLTPCTIGNGWLTVINLGRYAVTLYDKHTGKGIRVFVDASKMGPWSEIKSWYFKLKPKKEQNESVLLEEIREAGSRFCSIKRVRVEDSFIIREHRSGFAVCPGCGEAYPIEDGAICRGCQGEAPYVIVDKFESERPVSGR